MRTIWFAVAWAALVAACAAGQQAFEPTERATARSPQGFTAAEYDLSTGQEDLGEAKVWSDGAYRKSIQGTQLTVIHVGFELENRSNTSIVFDPDTLQLDSATLDRTILRSLSPVQVQGNTRIPPEHTARIDAYFPLPPNTRPTDVKAFRVHWRVIADELAYNQWTPFVEGRDETSMTVIYYYTPFYDPFFVDPYVYHPRIIMHRYPYRHYHVYRPR